MWGRPGLEPYLRRAHIIAIECVNFIETISHKDFIAHMPKMNHVALPPSLLMAKSNWGLYTYNEQDLGYNEVSVYIDQKSDVCVEYQIARKLTHQWISNTISPSWWNYIWMNDGLATFFGLYVTKQLFEQTRIMDRFVVEEQQLVLSKDIVSHLSPVVGKVETPEEIETVFSAVMQKKAAALVRMMYHLVPDEIFQKGINLYLRKYQFKTVTPDDLWTSLQLFVKGPSGKRPTWNFRTVMSNWLSVPNYPVVHVLLSIPFNKISLRQENLYGNELSNWKKWWIPISFATKSNPNFNVTSPSHWLSPSDTYLHINDIPGDDWVIVNLQQTGYYRVNYDTTNWQRLIEHLKSDNYMDIHPINRAQLIDDSYHLMLAGKLNSSIFLDLTNYLQKETDYISWYPMKAILSNMSTFFRYPESDSVKLHMEKILLRALQRIGFEENNNDTHFVKLAKLLIAEIACKFGQKMCLRSANFKLRVFLENPSVNVTSPWRDWVLCMGMKTMSASIMFTWQKMLNEYIRTKKYQYLESLSCVEDPSIITEFIRKLVSNDIPVLENDNRLRIIYNILEKHASKNMVLDYVVAHYNEIRTFIPRPLINILIMNVHSEEQFRKLEEFVRNHNFSQEEMQTHENFMDYLALSIQKQWDKIENERAMFADLFRSYY